MFSLLEVLYVVIVVCCCCTMLLLPFLVLGLRIYKQIGELKYFFPLRIEDKGKFTLEGKGISFSLTAAVGSYFLHFFMIIINKSNWFWPLIWSSFKLTRTKVALFVLCSRYRYKIMLLQLPNLLSTNNNPHTSLKIGVQKGDPPFQLLAVQRLCTKWKLNSEAEQGMYWNCH